MIRLLADENIVGLEQIPHAEIDLRLLPGRQIRAADVRDCDVLWVRSVTRVDAKLLAESRSLRFVGTATAGVEHVDQHALAERGIGFAAAPGANANAVVEYVLAALAELDEPWVMLERGEPLGLVGYGEVGRRFAEFARLMGWNLRVSDPWLESGPDAPAEAVHSLDEILACPVISLHCALQRNAPWSSYHLLGTRELKKLGSGQWLVNAARGPVIDNAALLDRLCGVDSPQCVLDVWEPEPAFESALLEQPSLRLATPHIAGYSWDAKWQATRMLYTALQAEGLVSSSLDDSAAAAPTLSVPIADASAASMRTLIEQRYCIREDDGAFRELKSLAAPERAVAFDQLRRNYRVRRELRGSVSQDRIGPDKPAALRLLRALGVAVPNEEDTSC